MEDTRIAIAWYDEVEYHKFKQSSLDPKTWADDHESWEVNAQSTLETLTLTGFVVAKVPMFLEDFQSWCDEFDSKNDGVGRSGYAAWKAGQ